MKTSFRILSVILSVMVMSALTGCSPDDISDSSTLREDIIGQAEEYIDAYLEEETESTHSEETEETVAETDEPEDCRTEDSGFSMTMLNVGQGLSILIDADGQYMLYDGGDRETSSYVVAYLQNLGITELNYIVTSHYDSDHIAGLVGVMKSGCFQIDEVVCPDYTADSSIYQSYISALTDCGAEVDYPSVGDTFSLGNAQITVTGPDSYDGDDENDFSVAVHITYGDCGFMITGDAGEEEENAMVSSGISLESEVLVVGHHGSSSSSSDAFINAVSPQYAFISCGAGNSYGHPTKRTLSTLAAAGTSIFRSDVQGEVTCHSDGVTVWFSTDPTDDWTPGTYTGSYSGNSESSAEETSESSGSYVLNTHSMKFHTPDCEAVGKMSDSNKELYEGSREELISQGYEPCGICNP